MQMGARESKQPGCVADAHVDATVTFGYPKVAMLVCAVYSVTLIEKHDVRHRLDGIG